MKLRVLLPVEQADKRTDDASDEIHDEIDRGVVVAANIGVRDGELRYELDYLVRGADAHRTEYGQERETDGVELPVAGEEEIDGECRDDGAIRMNYLIELDEREPGRIIERHDHIVIEDVIRHLYAATEYMEEHLEREHPEEPIGQARPFERAGDERQYEGNRSDISQELRVPYRYEIEHRNDDVCERE